MYLYFDKNKVLREIINDEAIVKGNGKFLIYAYYERQEIETRTSVSASFKVSNDSVDAINTISSDISYITDLNSEGAFIPYNPERDLKFFKYGKAYPFTVVNLATEHLTSIFNYPGVVIGTFMFYMNGSTIPDTTTLFTFVVENNSINAEQSITLSQFYWLQESLPGLDFKIESHITDRNNPHHVTKSQVGLGNVDNTSDLNKPVSNPVKLVLDTKQDKADLSGQFEELGELLNDFANDYIVDHVLYCKTVTVENNTVTITGTVSNNTLSLVTTTVAGELEIRISNLETTKADTSYVNAQLALKADKSTTYTKTDVDTALNLKADVSYVNSNFGHTIDLSIDGNYDMVLKLLDYNGNVISQDDVDLPLESIVVSATYYDTYTYEGTTYSKVIVIVLATTDIPTIVPVGDLVNGLVSTGDLATALADYVTLATQQTITGEKTFVGDLKFKGSGSVTTIGQITTTNYAVKIGYGGVNHITIGEHNFFTNVADYDLGSNSNKWRDLYLSRNLTDGTNTIAVANIVSKTTTIANIDLQDNITAQELTDELVFMNNTTDLDYVMGE